jgi:hypothetical protein
MQHYGVPTRLLDWSESPLIAAFFAAGPGASDDSPGIVWSLDPFRMNGLMHGATSLFSTVSPQVSAFINPPFSDKDAERDGAAAFFPHHVDLRLLVQLACFTIHGSSTPLDQHAEAGVFLRRFIIPVDAKRHIFNQLFRVGVRRSTLFPDLGGLAAEVDALRFQERPNEVAIPVIPESAV